MDGLISVIIPVYNVEQYLRECVDSVLGQTYQNFEIILVDDGSTDTSGDICDEYAKKDDRIQVIHKENGGASVARNHGIEMAKGEYVYFLDSDDRIVSNAFYILTKNIQDENADLLFFEAYSFDDNDNELKKGNYSYSQKYDTDRGISILEKLIVKKEFHVSIPLLFIKKDFLIHSGIRLVEGIMYEDMIFTYELFYKAEKVAHVRESLYHRRYRQNSVMQSSISGKNYRSASRVYKELKDFMIRENLEEAYVAKAYISKWSLNLLNIYDMLSFEERKIYKEDYRNLRADILEKRAYDNKALYMRCYGKFWWFCYKVLEKTINGLKGKYGK